MKTFKFILAFLISFIFSFTSISQTDTVYYNDMFDVSDFTIETTKYVSNTTSSFDFFNLDSDLDTASLTLPVDLKNRNNCVLIAELSKDNGKDFKIRIMTSTNGGNTYTELNSWVTPLYDLLVYINEPLTNISNSEDTYVKIEIISEGGTIWVDDYLILSDPITYRISGNVKNKTNNNPISNLPLSLKDGTMVVSNTMTDSNGFFEFLNIEKGTYDITNDSLGAIYEVIVDDDKTVNLNLGDNGFEPTYIDNYDNILNDLKVYPNPFKTQLNIDKPNFKIYDVNGKVVIQKANNNKPVNTSNFPSGVYLIVSDDKVKKAIKK